MHRFYSPDSHFDLKELIIKEKNELHHLKNVLRLTIGDHIKIFNGTTQEAIGEISTITPSQVCLQIKSIQKTERRKTTITLACAIPKKSKFELIIEKTTELGVDEIIPLKTSRTEINIPKERLHKKNLRYKTVAINAAKQSNRNTIPIIHPISEFDLTLKKLLNNSTVVMPSLIGKRFNLIKTLNNLHHPERISFLIGPEGDFTEQEYTLAHENGCLPVSLGETILKVETAAIAAIAGANLFYAESV